MGVWIETVLHNMFAYGFSVTPFVGVWIETTGSTLSAGKVLVTPFVGVWIETFVFIIVFDEKLRHTLRGCVD